MRQFSTDEEIRGYIEKSIEDIELLNECRLYREEQLQITERWDCGVWLITEQGC